MNTCWFSCDVIDLSYSDSDGDIPNVPLVVSPEMRIVELEDALNAVYPIRER
jgi:hypothetical protein